MLDLPGIRPDTIEVDLDALFGAKRVELKRRGLYVAVQSGLVEMERGDQVLVLGRDEAGFADGAEWLGDEATAPGAETAPGTEGAQATAGTMESAGSQPGAALAPGTQAATPGEILLYRLDEVPIFFIEDPYPKPGQLDDETLRIMELVQGTAPETRSFECEVK
jgi:hypothetical protein